MQISKRLRACAELVRFGAVPADVGTDHAYLPIFLLSEGKVERAHLSDINKGPLAKAKENVEAFGFADRVEYHLCAGATALADLGITDYCICGMGGELIRDIISEAPALFDSQINLILQPMTKPEALRSFLFENGFSILGERHVTEDGKYYVIINARFSGECVVFTEADAYFGREEDLVRGSSDALMYMESKRSALIKKIRGMADGGLDHSTEDTLLLALDMRIKILSDQKEQPI
jgi:tRNA (adenine22-N1)-methyltransferase